MFVKDHPSVIEELDVVDESDQITHLLGLEEAGKSEDILSYQRYLCQNVSFLKF